MISRVFKHKTFFTFRFDRHLVCSQDELIQYVVKCFKTLNLVQDMESLLRFIYKVQDSYNNVPYHNFRHAFEVLHSTCVIISTIKIKLSKIDKRILLIAALCHDIDHRGFSNTHYATRERLNLVGKTDGSINEIHHAKLTVNLLDVCKLFPKNTKPLYVSNVVTELILSTDVSTNISNNDPLRMCKLILRCADVSHPLRQFYTHFYWVFRHHKESVKEFQNKSNNVDDIVMDTILFLNNYVKPLYEQLRDSTLNKKLKRTISKWYTIRNINCVNNDDSIDIIHTDIC